MGKLSQGKTIERKVTNPSEPATSDRIGGSGNEKGTRESTSQSSPNRKAEGGKRVEK